MNRATQPSQETRLQMCEKFIYRSGVVSAGSSLRCSVLSHGANSGATVVRVDTDKAVFCVKLQFKGTSAIKREALFLSKRRGDQRFVTIHAHEWLDDCFAYVTDFVPGEGLDKVLVAERLTREDISDVFEDFISGIEMRANNRPDSTGLFDELVVKRITKRYKRIASSNDPFGLAASGAKVNNIRIRGTDYYLRKLCGYRAGLFSNTANFHGDLHLGNIIRSDKTNRLIACDPNGREGLPLEYDLGKILCSISGMYNHILSGQFAIENEKSSTTACFSTASPPRPTPLLEYFLGLIAANFSEKVASSARVMEAAHWMALVPHHMNTPLGLSMYLRAVEVLDEI